MRAGVASIRNEKTKKKKKKRKSEKKGRVVRVIMVYHSYGCINTISNNRQLRLKQRTRCIKHQIKLSWCIEGAIASYQKITILSVFIYSTRGTSPIDVFYVIDVRNSVNKLSLGFIYEEPHYCIYDMLGTNHNTMLNPRQFLHILK